MTVERHFAAYQAYHLDGRNKLTHYLGIPLIVYAILNLLYQIPHINLPGGVAVNFALVLFMTVSLFYLSLDVRLALGMGLLSLPVYFLAVYTPWWAGLTAFVVGWALQLVGHHLEGKKPAFLTNFVHLFIGPLWIASHLMEKLGLWAPRPVMAAR